MRATDHGHRPLLVRLPTVLAAGAQQTFCASTASIQAVARTQRLLELQLICREGPCTSAALKVALIVGCSPPYGKNLFEPAMEISEQWLSRDRGKSGRRSPPKSTKIQQ